MTEVALEVILILYALGIGLIIAEAFMPGAIMGIIGACALIASIYWGFSNHGILFGGIQTMIAVVVLPVALFLGLKRLTLKKSLAGGEGFTMEKVNQEQIGRAHV